MRGKKLGYNRVMHSETSAEKAPRANPFTADDVAAILRDHGWLAEKSPASKEAGPVARVPWKIERSR